MILQHAVKYHETRDWIHLQNQNTLTYQSLLVHCKQLEQHCEQFQGAKAQGELTSLSRASATTSSPHADTITFQSSKCPYCELPSLWWGYICHGTGHFTALCMRPWTNRQPSDSYKSPKTAVSVPSAALPSNAHTEDLHSHRSSTPYRQHQVSHFKISTHHSQTTADS